MAKLFQNPLLLDLANSLIQAAPTDYFNGDVLTKSLTNKGLDPKLIADQVAKRAAMKDVSQGVSIPQLFSLGTTAAKAHPYAALGLGTTALANISGLTDNDKLGGQLGGAALGALGGKLIGYNPIVSGVVGGGLGSLFDKLRAKKEQESQYLQPQQYN